MLPLDFFDYNNLKTTDMEVTQYVNDNLKDIIRTLIDFLADDNHFTSEDFLPYNNIRISDAEWVEMVYTLYEIVISPHVRDYIKPKYEYLLYVILLWWKECMEDEEFYIPNTPSDDLRQKIGVEYILEDGDNYISKAITDFDEYFYFLFYDHDFLPENVEQLTMMYLNNPKQFNLFFGEVSLNDYRILMPRDLQERYDDFKINQEKKIINDFSNDDLLNDIRFCCDRIQASKKYNDFHEDEFTDVIRDILKIKYTVKDQTRRGVSATGKSAGEVDLLVEKNNMPFSIIEALKLDCVNKSYISEHIDKVFGYDTAGNYRNYLISYVKKQDFKTFWEDYYKCIKSYEYPFELVGVDEIDSVYTEVKEAVVKLKRNGKEVELYNIAVRIHG